MGKRLRIGSITAAVVCTLALMAGGASTALGAAGTTMTPGEAVFNAALVARTSAVFETAMGDVTCTESASRGAVAERPWNVYEEEEEERAETLELPGAVASTFGTPTFRGCSSPGASSVTVSNIAAEAWEARAVSHEEVDEYSLGIPPRALRITITNTNGTCTIVAPSETTAAVGVWRNGSGGSASTATLAAQLPYTSSGTCIGNCGQLEAAGVLEASFTYSITNAAERGESIAF